MNTKPQTNETAQCPDDSDGRGLGPDPALTPEMVADLGQVRDALREVLNRKSMTCLTNWDVMNAVSQTFMTANRAHVHRSITLRGHQQKAMRSGLSSS